MQTSPTPKRNLPFQNMAPGAWVNLVLVAVACFYVLQVISDLSRNPLCVNLAVDYCAYWTAGRISNTQGYAQVYDQEIVHQQESAFFPPNIDPAIKDRTIPFVYLPVFVVPFQLLSRLEVRSSFVLWTILNTVGAILYLVYFGKKLTGATPASRLVMLAIFSIPVFYNLFGGQTNFILMVCVGEFLRAWLLRKDLSAGLWLAAFLLKPLFLVLLLPALVLQKAWKSLLGFGILAAILLGISYWMIGNAGLQQLVQVYLHSSQGGSASSPGIMINWRMLSIHLTTLASSSLGWVVLMIGSAITLLVAWPFLHQPLPRNTRNLGITLIGLLSATAAVTWHAHTSQLVILLPPFLLISALDQALERVFRTWVFIPILLTFSMFILASVTGFTQVSSLIIMLQIGLTGLVLNLGILAWALSRQRKFTGIQSPDP